MSAVTLDSPIEEGLCWSLPKNKAGVIALNLFMTPLEELKSRVLEVVKSRKEIYQEVDGFYYWWPEGSTHGCMAAHNLRIIADELDRMNKPWSDEIDRTLGEGLKTNSAPVDTSAENQAPSNQEGK